MAEHQGENLHTYLKGLKKPIDEISKDLGISRGTLYYYFRSVKLEPETIQMLKSRGYYPPADRPPDTTSPTDFTQKGNIIYIPLPAYGGFLSGYANKVYLDTLERFYFPGMHGEHFAFQVQGDSMVPDYKAGEIVISKKEERLEWMVKDRAYVLQLVDGIIIKKFDKILDGKAFFKSTNPNADNPIIKLKEIKGVYQALKVLKDVY